MKSVKERQLKNLALNLFYNLSQQTLPLSSTYTEHDHL